MDQAMVEISMDAKWQVEKRPSAFHPCWLNLPGVVRGTISPERIGRRIVRSEQCFCGCGLRTAASKACWRWSALLLILGLGLGTVYDILKHVMFVVLCLVDVGHHCIACIA